MNPEREEFTNVRRLIALKRYEQPPPGYFRDFSSRVILRIEREQASRKDAHWLQRFWAALETRPAFAGLFSATLCGLLVAGVIYSSRESAPTGLELVGQPAIQPLPPTGTMEAGMVPRAMFTSYQSNQADQAFPAHPALPSLFDRIQGQPMPASTGNY